MQQLEIVVMKESLSDLAKKINDGHASIERLGKKSLEKAKETGEWLLAAKVQCKHGMWLKWLEKNVVVTQMQAWRYMQVAEKWEECKLNLKFNLQEALQVLEQVNQGDQNTSEPISEEELQEESDKYEDEPESHNGHKKEETLELHPTLKPLGETKYVTLERWNELSGSKKASLLSSKGDGQFNNQGDNENIEWALWSWNPVTGCLHDCPYCYARDIANRFYDQGFAPSLYPGRIQAPRNTKYPQARIDNEEPNSWRRRGLGNVFVCSMADLFGRWVPKEWIDAVLTEVRNAPKWNFLFLTKFPIRMSEFDFPDNAWVGTTVDCQARVANAERAFRKIKAGIKWLSVEPMIEKLAFSDLGAFQWMVIGGSSQSTQTPEWTPPLRWVVDLEEEAVRCGVPFYEKSNLGARKERVRTYPGERPYEEPKQAPAALRYLIPKSQKEN